MAVPRRFAYYARLSAKDKAIYRASDAVPSIAVPDVAALAPLVAALESDLATGKRVRVAVATTRLVDGLLGQLGVLPVKIHVRAVRPDLDDGAELHGLYTFAQDGRPPKLEVWMRTALHERVVRFRTFLRTVLHELCHHLDVTLLGLTESFHTDGFFRRESSLVRQLAPRPRASRSTTGAPSLPTAPARRAPKQLVLF